MKRATKARILPSRDRVRGARNPTSRTRAAVKTIKIIMSEEGIVCKLYVSVWAIRARLKPFPPRRRSIICRLLNPSRKTGSGKLRAAAALLSRIKMALRSLPAIWRHLSCRELFPKTSVIIDQRLDLVFAVLLAEGVHVGSFAGVDDLDHICGAHFGGRFLNALHFELLALGGLGRSVRSMTHRALVEVEVLRVFLRQGCQGA